MATGLNDLNDLVQSCSLSGVLVQLWVRGPKVVSKLILEFF